MVFPKVYFFSALLAGVVGGILTMLTLKILEARPRQANAACGGPHVCNLIYCNSYCGSVLHFAGGNVDSIFSMVSIFFSFVNETYMIMSLKQRKRKRFKDKIEPQQIKPDKLSS